MKQKTRQLMEVLGLKSSKQCKEFMPDDKQKAMLLMFEQLGNNLEQAFAEAIEYFEKRERGTDYQFELHHGGKAIACRKEAGGRAIYLPLDLYNYIVRNAGKIVLKAAAIPADMTNSAVKYE